MCVPLPYTCVLINPVDVAIPRKEGRKEAASHVIYGAKPKALIFLEI